MLFPHTSSLYALPLNLEKKEVLYIDGIRYASEMVRIAYGRLCESLTKILEEDDPNSHRHLMTSAVHDAWSVIDSADRLRGLVFHSSLLDQIEQPKKIFLTGTETVRMLRNTLQHIDTLIPNHADAEWPVWGFLRWFAWSAFPYTGTSCQLLAGGHVAKRPFKIEGPRAGCLGDAISDVFLANKGVEVSLHEINNKVVALSFHVEGLIAKIAEDSQSSQDRFADIFISVGVDFRNK